MRRGIDNRSPLREAIDQDIKETAEGETGDE